MAIFGDNTYAQIFRDPMTPEIQHTNRTLNREFRAEMRSRLKQHSMGFAERTHVGHSIKTRYESHPLISGIPHFPDAETGHIMRESA